MELTNKPKQAEAEKVTTKRVRSFKLRTTSPSDDFRKRFYLWGIVKKVGKNGEAVLVSSGTTETSYWMDIDPTKQTVKEGDKCRFEITISSFIGRDKVIRTNLRVIEALILPSDAEDALENGFNEGYGLVDVEIMASTRTDTPGLFMLSMRRVDDAGDQKEWYYMRYYSNDRQHPDLGSAKVSFTIGKTKDLITDKGEIYTDIETRTYVDENGQTVTTESPVYLPALQVKSIER